jgi:hypothetical protein
VFWSATGVIVALALGVTLAIIGAAMPADGPGHSIDAQPTAEPMQPTRVTAIAPASAPRPPVAARPRAKPIDIAAHIKRVSARYGVSERLLSAIVTVESRFNPRAVSRKGAMGLMQLMPELAVLLGVRDAFDPAANIEAGARHLRDLLARFDDNVPLALAAWNAGIQAVLDHGGVPPYPETRQFVARVLTLVERGTPTPDTPPSVGVVAHRSRRPSPEAVSAVATAATPDAVTTPVHRAVPLPEVQVVALADDMPPAPIVTTIEAPAPERGRRGFVSRLPHGLEPGAAPWSSSGSALAAVVESP